MSSVRRYLLDTNVLVQVRRGYPREVLDRFRGLAPGEAAISVITYGELALGAWKSAERARAMAAFAEFVLELDILPMPEDAGMAYGEIRAVLERRGEIIGGNDLWIAAHALIAGLTLVTSNEREFRRIEALKVENWAAP